MWRPSRTRPVIEAGLPVRRLRGLAQRFGPTSRPDEPYSRSHSYPRNSGITRRRTTLFVALISAVVLGGCIPFAIDETGAQLIVQNETTDPMAGLAGPGELGFEVFASDGEGPGFGRLFTGGDDCGIGTLELYQEGHDAPVATIKHEYLCNIVVIYRGPDDIGFGDV